MKNTFLSIHLNSNRPKNLVALFDNLEKTTKQPSSIEVIIHVDLSDDLTKETLRRETKIRKIKIKYISSDLVKDYGTLWKPLNLILKQTDENAYFILNISDEVRFRTNNWDLELRKYINYYQDQIFRLRLSKYKYRNYFDYWENGFAPDSICFYTKKWMELSGDWNPCLGPDSFQQAIAYYLMTSDKLSPNQINRDIPINEVKITGEGAGRHENRLKQYKLIKICTRAWFILMSHKFQEEAKRRAMRMKACILSINYNYEYFEDRENKKFYLYKQNEKNLQITINYKICKFCITIKNICRIPNYLYYAGGAGENTSKIAATLFVVSCFFKKGEYLIYYYYQIKTFIFNIISNINNLLLITLIKLKIKNLISIINSLIVSLFEIIKNKHRKNNNLINIFNQLLDVNTKQDKTLISLLISANNINNLKELISNIEDTSRDICSIELIIEIIEDDKSIKSFLEDLNEKSKLNIKYFLSKDITTSNKFSQFLKYISRSSDFITMIQDDTRILRSDWDLIISSYKNYYNDGVYRIKVSDFKYFNYSEEWECGFAAGKFTFYSRIWLLLQDYHCQYTGNENFQSLVSFYMMSALKFSHNQYYRDLVEPFEIFSSKNKVQGNSGYHGLNVVSDSLRDFLRFSSYDKLQIAKKNAILLVTFINYRNLINQYPLELFELIDDGDYLIIKVSKSVKFSINYRLSKIKTFIRIIIRAIYYYRFYQKNSFKNSNLYYTN